MRTAPRRPSHPPQIEIRFGGLHLIIQRVPGWLITLASAALGTGTVWWTGR